MCVRSELESFVLYQKRFFTSERRVALAKAVGVDLILT
jgi:hypothetical protein